MIVLTILLQIIAYVLCSHKKSSIIEEKRPSAKFDNPNFIRDRSKIEIDKPEMPDIFKDRHRKPYNPAWMDYCDPYHCNDYHKAACGLNRATMRFKWFQSGCHVILNNQCSNYRGALRCLRGVVREYDLVDTKFCKIYVQNLRTDCPVACEADDGEHPVCGISSSNRVVLFKSRCAMDMVNCKKDLELFEEVDMYLCEYFSVLGKS